MSDWHAGFDQILQLVNVPISASILRSKGAKHHKPIVVTNGQVMEDVGRAVELFNGWAITQKINPNALEILNKGDLLKLFRKHATTVWPVNIPTQIHILKFLSSEGNRRAPFTGFCLID